MKTHWKLVVGALLLTALLWGALGFAATPRAQAQGGCANPYVVRYGDWLAQIARRHNTSVSVLMQLNPVLWWNPNLIYPGQVLCLPGVSRPPRALALEASYEYAPQAEIPVLQGKRATFHLTEARVVTDAAKLESAIKGSPAPAAMILKNTNAPGYALYEIGKNTLTLSTVITPTAALNLEEGCNAIAPVNTALSSMQALKTTMELAIERPDGFRVPLEITDVGLLDQPDKIFTCGSDRIVSILFPVRGQSNAYWALVPGKELQPISGPSPWYIPFSFFFGGWSYY